MVRAACVTLTLAFSLVVASQASAVPVSPADLDVLDVGSQVGSVVVDRFASASSDMIGKIKTRVYFDGSTYYYTSLVKSYGDFNLLFNTEFSVPGFTGLAGWSYGDAAGAGANGNGSDFLIENVGGRLSWIATMGGAFGEWNAFEPITFFFASTLPPTIKNYNSLSLLPFELGSAQGLAPVPEPGSIALFGSGLVWLYARMRRRNRAVV